MIYFARILYLLGMGSLISSIFVMVYANGGRRGFGEEHPEFWIPGAVMFAGGLVLMWIGNRYGGNLDHAVPGTALREFTPHKAPIDISPEAMTILTKAQAGKDVSSDELSSATRELLDHFDRNPTPAMQLDRRMEKPDGTNALWDGPVRIEPAFPPVPSTSWLGGNPCMPANLPWPDINGARASFFAQIDCSALPAETWGGLGPRHGWLLVFSHPDQEGCVRVLHTTELGQPRPHPPGTSYYVLRADGVEALETVLGKGNVFTPQWPLSIAPIDGQGGEELGAGAHQRMIDRPRFDVLTKWSLAKPGYLPFDWISAEMLLNLIEDKAFGDLCVDGVNVTRFETARRETAQVFNRFRDELLALKDDVPFDDAVCECLIEGLKGLSTMDWHDPIKVDITKAPKTLFDYSRLLDARYANGHELRARQVYAVTPNALPPDVRALYEPVWQDELAMEKGQIGGKPPGVLDEVSGGGLLLLALPSSELLGWMFGDMSDWGVFIRPTDLEAGDFTKAYASSTHGH